MLLQEQIRPGYLERIMDILKSPIRPKHIRLSAVLICVNQFVSRNRFFKNIFKLINVFLTVNCYYFALHCDTGIHSYRRGQLKGDCRYGRST